MKKIILPEKMTEDLAEETGLHLGDGSMNFYNGKGLYQLRGHFEDDKPHYILIIKPLYKRLFNIDVSLRDMPSTRVFGFQLWSDELINFKKNILGLPLGPKRDFLVPSIISENDEFSKSFIRGFFDTDGCLYLEYKNHKLYPRIEMVSISGRFITQMHMILLRLGFRVTYEIREDIPRHNYSIHKLSIRGMDMTKKWFSEIKPNNPKHIRKFEKLNSI
ncbi:MAG: LAGLIDADG family homing endonuclease [Candidatus Woesearchaeota archaeon]